MSRTHPAVWLAIISIMTGCGAMDLLDMMQPSEDATSSTFDDDSDSEEDIEGDSDSEEDSGSVEEARALAGPAMALSFEETPIFTIGYGLWAMG